jgi:hypothetical protein
MNIAKIVQDVHDWHVRNYPTETDSQSLLAIGEEMGELMRAELKQAGNIRGTFEHWQTEKFKECGDVLIGLIEYAARTKTEGAFVECFEDLLENTVVHTFDNEALLQMAFAWIGHLMETYQTKSIPANAIYNVAYWLGIYATANQFNLEQVLEERWKTISQRDFIANPETGGREKEDQEPTHKIHFISATLTGEGIANG